MSEQGADPFYYVQWCGDWWAAYRVRVSDPERTIVFFCRVDEPEDGVPTAQTHRLHAVAQQLARKDDAGWARQEQHIYSYG